jgi:DNA-nicking Smr family endonuclease
MKYILNRKNEGYIIIMRKKNDPDKDENALFRSVMRGVKPLVHTKISVKQPIPRRKQPHLTSQKTETNPFSLYDEAELSEVSGEDLLEFHRDGLQHKVLRKLRRGQYNVEATLDMHGMRVTEARENLSHFLMNCFENNIRHAMIIHGKGHSAAKPVLKNKLNQWLRQIKYVLAFCSATLQDGRSGAVYVLLKGDTKVDE